MTSVPRIHPLVSPVDRPAPTLRLRLKPKGSLTGYVDGGWWPRTQNLTNELPALAQVLAVRLGSVTRVAYPLDAWDDAPRQLTVEGHTIRLEGFHSQDQHVLHVSGPDRQRITVVVIPPDAMATAAHEAMTTASRRDNIDRPGDLLFAAGALPDIPLPRLKLVHDKPYERG
jgi:Family of unknown function (DUF5994)